MRDVSLPSRRQSLKALAVVAYALLVLFYVSGGLEHAAFKALGRSDLEYEIWKVRRQTIELRGSNSWYDVPVHLVTAEQLGANLVKHVEMDYASWRASRDSKVLWLMRLLDDRSVDLRAAKKALASEAYGGYYDPDERELFAVGGQDAHVSPFTRLILSHEFVHSMQDEYIYFFDLYEDEPEYDEELAVSALIEGDATFIQREYGKRYLNDEDWEQVRAQYASARGGALDTVPEFYRKELDFPYDEGYAFVAAAVQRAGGDVNEALTPVYADPPTSSEQLLHPEKYLATPRDDPMPVVLPPLTTTLGIGWTYRETDTIGEFSLGYMMEANGSSADLAQGWGAGVGHFTRAAARHS
jgi:hypothetical protein